METWTGEPWIIIMSLTLGVGAFIIARTIELWHRGSLIPKEHSEWVNELDVRLRDLQASEIQKAMCYRRVAELIGQVPKDFDAVALSGMQMSDSIGRAILAKSEDMGIYPRGTFEKLGVVPYEDLPVEDSAEASAEAKEEPSNGHGIVKPWVGSFIGGRLVPAAQRLISPRPN